MATTLSLVLRDTLRGYYRSDTDLTKAAELIEIDLPPQFQKFTNGTGVHQANRFVSDKLTVGIGGTSLDVRGTTLLDIFGQAFNLTVLRAIRVCNIEDTTGTLEISGNLITSIYSGTGAGFKDFLGPRAVWHKTFPVDGLPITAGVNDIITFTAQSGSIQMQYDLIGAQ